MKKLLAVILSVIMVFSFAACAGKSANNEGESQTEETTTIRIGAMAGPTAMGMVKLRKDSENGNTKNTYAFEDFATDASAFVTPLATGEIDIAAVPSNLAANIYNKTEGKVQVVAVNTLGVLNTIRYILSGNGLDADKDVNIVWCSDTTEALSKLKSEDGAIAVLPQPFVTAASAQISGLRVVMDLNEAWEKINNNSKIVTGVIVVRKEFAEKYPEQLKKFIDEYNESVAYTSSNIDETAQLIAEYGIVASEAIAEKALPKCHIVCYINNNMRSALEGFLQVLYDQNPKSVGGSMPKDDFYYEY